VTNRREAFQSPFLFFCCDGRNRENATAYEKEKGRCPKLFAKDSALFIFSHATERAFLKVEPSQSASPGRCRFASKKRDGEAYLRQIFI